ncbi:MAG: FAD/NAD(P)-binding protein [Candidatus Eremiobacteraeota bacterium]|nr:FAD/NAD(P)-binding protein [Candidatus Eremiobacteraeota bacterium]
MRNLYVPTKAVIEKIKTQTHDTKTFTIKPANGEKFDFEPGQFNMVSLLGYGEAPISISSSPDNKKTFDHTIRFVGSLTNTMEKHKEGSIVGIRGPYGSSWPVEEAKGKNVIFVAGGIGLAPLRPFIMQMFHDRDSYGKIQILYGARGTGEMLFTDEFNEWKKHSDTELHLTVDKLEEGEKWDHTVGVVTVLYDVAKLDPANTIAVICGPEIMMRFACRSLLKKGFYAPQIYLSLERRMKCGVGKCGHCQLGSKFVCKDGPVFRYDEAKEFHDTLL